MAKELACRNCKCVTTSKICPSCKSTDLSPDWNGITLIVNPSASKIAKKLEEVNLSNAKLLYTNRVLSSASLNERQKRRIVEAISKAETTKEAKVIYETLQSTVGSTEKRPVPKALSEAVSRNSSLLISSQRNREKTTTDPLSERLQLLAGIKK